MMRFTKKGEDPVLGVVTASGCVAHRCDQHEDLPPVNQEGPDKSECGGCVGQAFAEAFEKAFEKRVFWPLITSARDRLNLLAPGAGDSFQEEARATLNAASIDLGDDEPDYGPCSKCGLPLNEHGYFGFRDHAFLGADGETRERRER